MHVVPKKANQYLYNTHRSTRIITNTTLQNYVTMSYKMVLNFIILEKMELIITELDVHGKERKGYISYPLFYDCTIFCAGSGSSLWTEDIMAGSTPTDYLKLTSSRAVLVEGGSVEFVCEASVSWVEGEEVEGEREEGSGGHGQYEPYTVTWSVRSSSGSGSDGALLQPMVDSTDTSFPSSITQLLNNHILRVGGVSSGSTQYCCEVYAGQRIGQECTTIHVVPQRGM